MKEKYAELLRAWLENPYWREYYEMAYRWCGNSPEKKRIHDRIAELGGE